MRKYTELAATAAVIATTLLFSSNGGAQTPEQQKNWDADRARAVAEEPCDEVRIMDARNTLIRLRLDLRGASTGTYVVEARVVPPGAAEPLTARAEFTVE